MATNTIQSPRIDRGFVTVKMPGGPTLRGELTDYAYSLLYNLIRRTGGTNGEIIDVDGIRSELDAFALAPIQELAPQRQDDPAPPATTYEAVDAAPDGRMQALEAEVAKLRDQMNGLQQGYQL